MESKKYHSEGHHSITVRKATKRDIPKFMENLAAVASEEVYLGTEQVTLETRRVHPERLKEKKT
ncbi:MAG: hypothetical protein JRN20_00780 [Nitrososphaerota archaeon]|nr:hypothetical protein [Nitrososphaerota archaeon]MDG6924285.1 hypothetical protein [Nitrososphaerota archaeon]